MSQLGAEACRSIEARRKGQGRGRGEYDQPNKMAKRNDSDRNGDKCRMSAEKSQTSSFRTQKSKSCAAITSSTSSTFDQMSFTRCGPQAPAGTHQPQHQRSITPPKSSPPPFPNRPNRQGVPTLRAPTSCAAEQERLNQHSTDGSSINQCRKRIGRESWKNPIERVPPSRCFATVTFDSAMRLPNQVKPTQPPHPPSYLPPTPLTPLL